MKILIVGNWHSQIHEEPIYQVLKQSQYNVFKFKWNTYVETTTSENIFKFISKKAQNKYIIGPIINKLNKDFLEYSKNVRPDVIFIYRGTHIFKKILSQLHKELDTIIVGYNNDDPFSPNYQGWEWRHFLDCIPEYDLVLSYRKLNIESYWKAGAKKVELLRSWYLPEKHYPMRLNKEEIKKYGCDVVFIGHFEDDGRKEVLEKIIKKGINLRVFGPGWEKVKWNVKLPKSFLPITPVTGPDYNKALNACKIALCFFSRLNRDTYTRRCFEIPATGKLLLSEYSEDLANLYLEGLEAEYFRDDEELIKKINFYLSNQDLLLSVANSGRRRAKKDGYDIYSRVKEIVGWCKLHIGDADGKK